MQVTKTKPDLKQCRLLRIYLECENWDTAPTFEGDMDFRDLETYSRTHTASPGRFVGCSLIAQVPTWPKMMIKYGRRMSGTVD